MSDQSGDKRLRLVQRATEHWRSQLVDMTGRNRLIYYKELKSGTLNLADADPARGHALSEGEKVRLTELFDPTGREITDETANAPDSTFDAAMKRIRTIARSGQANFEERGINTILLSSHLVTWDAGTTSSAIPNAPALLVPLEIRPLGGAQADFELQIVGEWEVNQTLTIFWNEVFGAYLDPEELNELTQSGVADLDSAANGLIKMAAATGLVPAVSLQPGQLIGNFHYTKLPMVKDLESSVAVLAANDIIAAIAGDTSAATTVRDSNASADISPKIPDYIPPEDEFLILDADSSQSHVINTVLAERSTMIEGPPGTGKSQTISNLIASLAAGGKSVLFVAEKRAAIEAVLKRLDGVGLSDLALDLHTNVIRKKDLAQALQSSLTAVGAAPRPDVARDQAELRAIREKLVGYEHELHRPVPPWEWSSFQLNTHLLDYRDVPTVDLRPETITRLTDDELVRVNALVEQWGANRQALDWESPWATSSLTDARHVPQLNALIDHLRMELLPYLQQAVEATAAELGADLSSLSVQHLQQLGGFCADSAEVASRFDAQIWQYDLHATVEVLNTKPRFGRGSSEYRTVAKGLKELRTRRVSAAERREAVETAERTGAGWAAYRLPGAPRDVATRQWLTTAIARTAETAEQLREVLPTDSAEMTLDALSATVDRLSATREQAVLVAQLSAVRSQLVLEGIEPLLQLVERGSIDESAATRVLEHSVLRGRRYAIDASNQVLNTFRSETQDEGTARYAEADRRHLKSASQRVMRRVAERALEVRNQFPEQNAIVEREAKKKTRHKSLRQLQSEASDVLTALKPCWMMSPLMVSQSLPAGPIFDYVIFDEASQIRPEEAIAAISRGRHLVVAGDRRQLPPSAFFDTADADIEDYNEDSESADALTAGYQSILDVAGALLPARMLTWHYRSRDERLIALSNAHIYGGSLTTFPGAQQISPITFHHVSHSPRSHDEIRSNPTEVARVVDLMIDHATTHPDDSLGVIAFGQHHASAIEDALFRRLRQENSPPLDRYFDSNRRERVFIKNIERVQGDERDTIILTVGYGKDLNGRVPHRFGPVNQDGGERRINVAASRARSRMAVVSSITAEDLDTSQLGRGPQLLQQLLHFAATGGNDVGMSDSNTRLNAFELAVKFELEKLGLRPICQYGASGFRIDFALPHPSNDGRMVLAVEADGASYHSSQTARDRDRLRQQILEDKGWRFHRIWSTAFFKDPEAEAAKVKTAFNLAVLAADGGTDAEPPIPRTTPEPASASRTRRSGRPSLPVGVPIDQHDHRMLVALVRWITNDSETLLTDAEIKERMKGELGYQKLGSKIDAAFTRAIDAVK